MKRHKREGGLRTPVAPAILVLAMAAMMLLWRSKGPRSFSHGHARRRFPDLRAAYSAR